MPASSTLITLRYAGTCVVCGADVPAGTRAYYDRGTKSVVCHSCGDAAPASATHGPDATDSPNAADPSARVPRTRVAPGSAGGSAMREYGRRSARRARRIRDEHPILGGLILALSEEPQSTRAWATGALGEQALGRWLDQLTSDGVRLLHDRGIPGTRANIDHIAVGPAGVFVIDAKNYRGRVEVASEGGWGRPRVDRLMVGGRDRTKLVAGMHVQVETVRRALAARDGDSVPVTGMLCFVAADWPLLGGAMVIERVHVLWPNKIKDHVLRDRSLDEAAVDHWHRTLAGAFRAA